MSHLRRFLMIIFMVFLIYACVYSFFKPPKIEYTFDEPWINNIDELIQHYMNQDDIPGVQITEIYQGEIEKTKVYGFSSTVENIKVNEHTIFQAQSMTKTLTATLALKLVSENVFSLDDRIRDLLPSEKLIQIPKVYHDATVKQLLNHQSGMPTGDFNKIYHPFNDQIPSLEASIMMDLNRFKPQSGFHYSNVGYHVLEMMIEELTGMSYEEHIEKLFFSLDIYQSSFRYDFYEEPNFAYGHDLNKNQIELYRYPEFSSGGLLTNTYDFSLFLLHLFQEDIINNESIDMMLRYDDIHLDVYDLIFDGYGLGIFIDQTDHGLIVSHGGQGKGYMSYYHYDIQNSSGFVICMNSQRGYPLLGTLTESYQMYYGLESSGLSKISYISYLLIFVISLMFVVSFYLLKSMFKKIPKHQKMGYKLIGLISIISMIGCIILKQIDYLFIKTLAPSIFELFVIILFISSLIGVIHALVLICYNRGGDKLDFK